MEQPGQKTQLLAGSLEDLGRINRWIGGTRLTLWGLDRLAGHLSPGSSLSILDVATGGADIPEAEFRWSRRRGLNPEVVASDRSREILALVSGKRRTILHLVAADALCLPFADRSFDVSSCSLVLHHFDPEGAVLLLSELRRVARLGVIVNDLVRSWHGYLGAWLVGHLLTRNPFTRHDGPLSVRRAYTRAEMVQLARDAGLGPVRFAGFLGYRVAMISGGGP